MQYKIEFLEDFSDGHIFPDMKRVGTTMVVDEAIYRRIKSSAPSGVAMRGIVIPPPSRVCVHCGVTYEISKEHTCEKAD